MPRKKAEARKRKIRLSTLLLACVLFFCAVVAGTFYTYRTMLDREFEKLVQENLTAYTNSQQQEIDQYLTDVGGTIRDLARLFSSMEYEPESEWAQTYLARVNTEHERFEISYIPIEQLQEFTTDEEESILRALLEGKGAVSEVRESQRLGGRFFGVAEPVTRDGKVVGAVRSTLSAQSLVQTSQTGYLRESIRSFIVKENGDFVAVNADDAVEGRNLFEEVENREGMEETEEIFRGSLLVSNATTAGFTEPDGRRMFVSAAGLGYNGWNLVNFASVKDVMGYSQNILRHTTVVCAVLVLFTVILACIIAIAINKQQQQLQRSELRYDLLSRFCDTTLYIYDYKTDVMEWSENARKVIAVQELRMANYARGNRECELMHPEDVEIVRKARTERLPEGESGYFEARILDTNDEYRWFGCQYQTLYEHGAASLFVGKLSDIATHKEREERLREQVKADPLTGLLNAPTLLKRVQQRLDENGYGFFFMIDVDNFKRINDTYGHVIGDAALGCISDTLRATFREGDLIGRLGGDEFAAFMEGARDREAAKNRASLLLEAITAVRVPDTPELRLSVSIGVAGSAGGKYSARELYAAADHAMYTAKRDGKDTFHVADSITE